MALAKFMSLLTLCALEGKRILYSSTFYSPHINKYIQINMLSCAHHTALCQQLGCFFFLCSYHLLILYHMLNIKTVLIFFCFSSKQKGLQSSRKNVKLDYILLFLYLDSMIPCNGAWNQYWVYYYLIIYILWYYRK